MNQSERRRFLISYLLDENKSLNCPSIPQDEISQKQLLRALMNIREPKNATEEFLRIQDAYLQEEIKQRGIVDVNALQPMKERLYLWQGDCTTLACDAIVNAANSSLTGCYVPNHGCIDNCIHTYAGIQLRLECHTIRKHQGYAEPTGTAKITKAYNLPCRYVIHTVGPIIQGKVSVKDKLQLQSCYRSCLKIADEHHLESIAFCCISTGEFHFPHRLAAQVAVQTVQGYLQQETGIKKVIFNVFKDEDRKIYEELL